MERTALTILGTLVFCVAGCADIWQFEDLQAASDAPSPDAVAILDDAAIAEAESDGGASVLAMAPAPHPVAAAVDPVPDAAPEARCASCTTSALAIMCPGPMSACNGKCVDTKNDTENCGGCGAVCSSGGTCHKGMCTAH
jgi:hypothetical protein